MKFSPLFKLQLISEQPRENVISQQTIKQKTGDDET